ncbi:MAG: HNH endonuclease [Verrucomicrobiota bacterium]
MKHTITDRHARSNGQGQGMNWIRKEKRLAIYLRDGLACCYCGEGVEDEAKLTLDHLKPHSQGGTNETSNLITACHRCNSLRRNRGWTRFAADVARYINHGTKAEDITRHIKRCVRRSIDLPAAKKLISKRGFVAALRSA